MNIAKQIASLQRRLARLETKQNKSLVKLPEKLGYRSGEELIAALQACFSSAEETTRKVLAGGRKARAVVTDAVRERVRRYVAKQWTSKEIAEKLDLAVPTVQNVKKALGLVRKRGVEAGPTPSGRKHRVRAITMPMKEQIRTLSEKHSREQIAKKMDLSTTSVKRVYLELGLAKVRNVPAQSLVKPTRKVGEASPSHLVNQVIEMSKAGKPVTEIVKTTGLSRKTVTRIRAKNKLSKWTRTIEAQ